MKDKNCEFVERIESQFVGDDCVKVFTSHRKGGITLLNADKMTYHYKPNSYLYINEYESDIKKYDFPFSEKNIHKGLFGKTIYIDQLFEFDRTYLEISNGVIKEYYAKKDGNEALLATKAIAPRREFVRFMNRDQINSLIKSVNVGIYNFDGGCCTDFHLPSNEEIVEMFKRELIKRRRNDQSFDEIDMIDQKLNDLFNENIKKINIDDVPSGFNLIDNVILVSKQNNEINSVKTMYVEYIDKGVFVVEMYDYPITIYSMKDLKQLELLNSKKEKQFVKTLRR